MKRIMGRKLFLPNFLKGEKMSKIETFITAITPLNRFRTIRVYLPPGYRQNNETYSVLYMHDGHNLFTEETSGYGKIWDAHLALDHFYQKTGVKIILVGIDCEHKYRFDEYSPWPSATINKFIPALNIQKVGGAGDKYIKWLAEELITLINSKYRTNGINYMAGSSMGAYITLYGGLKYLNKFKKIGCFSTAFWFQKEKMTAFIKEKFNPNLAIYLDVGTDEGNGNFKISQIYLKDTLEAAQIFKNLGVSDLKLYIDEGANHSETAWKKRFPLFIEWLLSNPK